MKLIYRTTDKIKVKIDDITVKITPLSYIQKQQVQDLMQKAITESDMKYAMEGAICAIKNSLKHIEGLSTVDGDSYQLEIEDKMLTDECIDDLLNMQYSHKLSALCTSLVNGVGREFVLDPRTQEPLEGIEFVTEDFLEKKS